MVKFTNKAKGRPSKRKTLKVKYKIQRKVKQHKKRVKKQAQKFKGKGLKHKGIGKSQYLPNMFPFKQQILEEARKSLPQTVAVQSYTLDQSEYGLISLQNKSAYLPKPKENLIKKYVTNLDKLLENVHVVLQLLEIRNPIACIDQQFREKCNQRNIKIISILTKIDTIQKEQREAIQIQAQSKCSTLLKFSVDHKLKSACLQSIMQILKSTAQQGNILVAGKALTGKHTFITNLSKHVGKYQENSYQLNLIKITQNLKLIDSPYKLQDKTGYPLFIIPNPILQESIFSQEQRLIKDLFFQSQLIKRQDALEHFAIQDYKSVTDFLTKVGKAWKIFGKGGNIDINRVRSKIISDWFNGKLNHLLVH